VATSADYAPRTVDAQAIERWFQDEAAFQAYEIGADFSCVKDPAVYVCK